MKQHTGYEVAIFTVWCFCTKYEIVTAGSEVMVGMILQCM